LLLYTIKYELCIENTSSALTFCGNARAFFFFNCRKLGRKFSAFHAVTQAKTPCGTTHVFLHNNKLTQFVAFLFPLARAETLRGITATFSPSSGTDTVSPIIVSAAVTSLFPEGKTETLL
jgi:hypothetical protein